jgi:hypothetical protein
MDTDFITLGASMCALLLAACVGGIIAIKRMGEKR